MDSSQNMLRNLQGKTIFKISIIAILASLVSAHFVTVEFNENSIKAAQRIVRATAHEVESKMKQIESDAYRIKQEIEGEGKLTDGNLANLRHHLVKNKYGWISKVEEPKLAIQLAHVHVAESNLRNGDDMEKLNHLWLILNRFGNAWSGRYLRMWINFKGQSQIEFEPKLEQHPLEEISTLKKNWDKYYKLNGDEGVWSDFFFLKNEKLWMRTFIVPVLLNGKVEALLGLDLSVAEMTELGVPSKTGGDESESVLIGDLNGEILVDSKSDLLDGNNLPNADLVGVALGEIKKSEKLSSNFYDKATRNYFIWSKSPASKSIYVIRSSAQQFEDSVYSVLIFILIMNGLSFALQSLVMFHSLRQEIEERLFEIFRMAKMYIDSDVVPVGQSNNRQSADEIEALKNVIEERGSTLLERREALAQLSSAMAEKRGNFLGATQSQFEDDRFQISKAIQLHNNLSVGELAGGVAHEINNPLAVLNGHANLLKRILGGELKRQELIPNLIDKMEIAINRMNRILDGLLIYTNSVKHEKSEFFALDQVLQLVRERTQARIGELGINLRIHCSAEFKVMGQFEQLTQAILCLVENAVDAVAELEAKWIVIDVRQQKNWLEVKVIDSGNGIPPSVVEKMMNPFFTTKEVGQGTGLGLCVAQGIIENLGGTIAYITRAPNTTFEVKLPRYDETT